MKKRKVTLMMMSGSEPAKRVNASSRVSIICETMAGAKLCHVKMPVDNPSADIIRTHVREFLVGRDPGAWCHLLANKSMVRIFQGDAAEEVVTFLDLRVKRVLVVPASRQQADVMMLLSLMFYNVCKRDSRGLDVVKCILGDEEATCFLNRFYARSLSHCYSRCFKHILAWLLHQGTKCMWTTPGEMAVPDLPARFDADFTRMHISLLQDEIVATLLRLVHRHDGVFLAKLAKLTKRLMTNRKQYNEAILTWYEDLLKAQKKLAKAKDDGDVEAKKSD